MSTYHDFLQTKKITIKNHGFDISHDDISPILFDYQKDIVKWCIHLGKAAIFSMTGTGKTLMQLEFARQIILHTDSKVLIVAPLAVSRQTVEEAKKINLNVSNLRHGEKISRVNILNYEQLENLDCSQFDCVILDESSILKNFSGKIRNEIIQKFKHCKYKLACTATPSPNDFMELGNHAEFLDIMSRVEMLSNYFIHDAGDTGTWRLKKHAEAKFWEFVASWAAILTKPSDLGYSDEGFILPPLNYHEIVIESENTGDFLFAVEAQTLQERRAARRETTDERVKKVFDIIMENNNE
jgi:hypothetical protein